ncbi:MAG: hypothetical protein ABIH35_03240 [Patescibacteria group bacterium]
MKIEFLAAFAILLFAGCAAAVPITKEEYKIALGSAVCTAVQDLNEQGILADEAEFPAGFERAVERAVNVMGYSDREWLKAKEKYFTPKEHEKLIKIHFTWCLVSPTLEK